MAVYLELQDLMSIRAKRKPHRFVAPFDQL